MIAVEPSKPDVGLIHCGSGLARDGITALCLLDPIACIAGKPAPTSFVVPSQLDAGLPHRCCGALKPEAGLPHCGSGLARDGITALCLPDPIARIAGKPACVFKVS